MIMGTPMTTVRARDLEMRKMDTTLPSVCVAFFNPSETICLNELWSREDEVGEDE